MEAQVIKSLLESFNIPSTLRFNFGPSPFGSTMNEVGVMVREDLAEKARQLIKGEEHA